MEAKSRAPRKRAKPTEESVDLEQAIQRDHYKEFLKKRGLSNVDMRKLAFFNGYQAGFQEGQDAGNKSMEALTAECRDIVARARNELSVERSNQLPFIQAAYRRGQDEGRKEGQDVFLEELRRASEEIVKFDIDPELDAQFIAGPFTPEDLKLSAYLPIAPETGGGAT